MKVFLSFTYIPLLALLFLSSSIAQCDKKEEIPTDTGNADGDSILVSEYAISPDKNQSTSVSNLLMGFNLIYPHEKDEIWKDGKIAGYFSDVDVAFLRYPGGTVCSYYHWNALSGEGWKDSWDPQNPVTLKASTEFMDIDEYISLVKTSGATPLVGINMSSGWRWNRKEDGLREAIALMQYCREKEFHVEYWYLDNEPYQEDSNGGAKTAEQYAGLINTYVPAMKAVDPDIKIVANWNAGFKNKRAEYDRLITMAGANIDIVDAHWYWSWNDASWEKWLEKTPMVQWTGYSYESDIQYFRLMVKDLGYPDIKLASFEWNTGPVKLGNSLTASRVALVHAEMMMQFFSGGLDYAVLWPVHWPDEASKTRSFVNTSTNAANPNYHLFKFLGKMQGGEFTELQITGNVRDMVSLAVLDAGSKTLRICVLNKNNEDRVTDIRMDKFPAMSLREAQMYIVSPDGSKYFTDNVKVLKSEQAEIIRFKSKSISLTMLTFAEK
jgi:alpha-L-arabinofuranosidase